jgi:hypothetical protein
LHCIWCPQIALLSSLLLRLLCIEEGSAPVRALHLNGTEDNTFPGITTKEDHHIFKCFEINGQGFIPAKQNKNGFKVLYFLDALPQIDHMYWE